MMKETEHAGAGTYSNPATERETPEAPFGGQIAAPRPAAEHDTDNASIERQIAAAQQAVRAALRDHKLAGNPIAVWRDGKVVLVPPEQIEA
jgi:hypothetical protein